jgi:CRP-like cAMP-binding protein
MTKWSTDRKIELLKGVWLFSGCSVKELRHLGSVTERVTIPDQTVIMAEGHSGRDLCIILEGRATASINGRVISELESGSFFGELALIDNGPRSATVVADGPIEALILTRNDFRALIDTTPSVARKVLAVLGARLREADQQLTTG